MNNIIPCELCTLPAEYTIQATEIAGEPFDGTIKYYCNEHYIETVKELEA